jgi:NitT/TauT family transport system substrate-binding protein
MTESLRRADFLRATASAAAAAAAAATGFPAVIGAQTIPKISYGDLYSGVTGIISSNLAAKHFDQKHGVDMSNLLPYTSVSTYYNDFAAGTFDVAMGSWDFFVDMQNRGVPIKIVCTVTTADMINIIAGPGIKSVNDLVGKSCSAVVGSGSFEMSRAVVRDVAKVDLDKQVQMQNAPNPAGCIALLQSGSANAALSWEPVISNAIAEMPTLRPIFNLGHAYRQATGGVLPYFTVAVRNDALAKSPGLGQKIAGIFGDTIAYINHDTADAFATAAPKTGLSAAVMQSGYSAKRLVFESYAMSNPSGLKVVTSAYAYLHARGMFEKPLAPDFYA